MVGVEHRQGETKVTVRFLRLLTAALEAFVAYRDFKKTRYLYEIEDEIDQLARAATPSAKLRIERLDKRLERERKRVIRSSDIDSD